jgi:hypothetical protein
MLILVVGFCCVVGAAPDPAKSQYPKDPTVWPNAISKANSDEWIVKNHDKIRVMKPMVLVINFANGFSQEKQKDMTKQLIAAVSEGSRYHGYKDEKAPAFLQYQIFKMIDLQDLPPYPTTPDENCTKYPRSNKKDGPNFAYKELYSEKFAEYYGVKDPENPKRYLKLNELVAKGIIHEVWFFAYQRDAGAPFECTEWKPVYDENFKRIGDEHRMSGNGGDPDEPWFGRSLRINFINAERGIGCNIESLSHSFEGTAHSNVIPYFRKYFYEFASFDIDKRFSLPWNSLYAVWGEKNGIEYPDDHTAIITQDDKTYKIENYYCIGGNVHWTPSGRNQYDLGNPNPVMSTIEHYRLFDGPDGKDKAEPWTIEKFQRYEKLAPDCMGKWLIYWRQNLPGLDNKCKDDNGKPMKNWWPFLFY